MPAQFVEEYRDCGFDGTANPPWLLVETRYSNWAWLQCTGYGQITLTSSNPGVATARCTGKMQQSGSNTFMEVVVEGRAPGTTYISATGPGTGSKSAVWLEVLVIAPRTFYANFHFVTDGRGVRTKRNAANAKQLLADTTKVYNWQASVYWRLYQWREVTIKLDFVSGNQSQAARNKLWATLSASARQFDSAAGHFNLFCVREWGMYDSGTGDVVGSNAVGGNIGIFQDSTDFLTVAHELGHGLSLQHNDSTPNALMYWASDDGKKIYKNEVRQIRMPTQWVTING